MSDASSTEPKAPAAHQRFIEQYPDLKDAWSSIAEAGRKGPLDERTIRLLKLAFSMGARLEGAVHSNVRKCLAADITPEEIYQVVGMAAGCIGLPSTVAVYTWAQDILEK